MINQRGVTLVFTALIKALLVRLDKRPAFVSV